MPVIKLASQELAYSVRVSGRARRISVRVDQGQVTLVLPRAGLLPQGEVFIRRQERWITSQLAQTKVAPWARLTTGSVVRILGEELLIEHHHGERIKVCEQSGTLRVTTPTVNSAATLAKISKYLRDKYGPLIKYRVEELAKLYSFSYREITIRDQTSRWGSCSHERNLNFNWRLIFAPIKVMDYVIIHELAHTLQMNHSAKFWAIVERCDPSYQHSREWLKQNRNFLAEF